MDEIKLYYSLSSVEARTCNDSYIRSLASFWHVIMTTPSVWHCYKLCLVLDLVTMITTCFWHNQKDNTLFSYCYYNDYHSLNFSVPLGSLLLDHAVECGLTQTDVYTAQRWCEGDLSLVVTNLTHYSTPQDDLDLVYQNYTA